MSTIPTKIYFDGGCRPNPGPMETGLFVHGVAHIRTELARGGNSEAEWLALIHAAEFAIVAHFDDVVFIGDSLLVINQAKGSWKCRSADLRAHLQDFQTLAARIGRVRLRHVPRSKNLAGIALQRRHDGLDRTPAAALVQSPRIPQTSA